MLQKFKPLNHQCSTMRAECMKLIASGGAGGRGAVRAHAFSVLRHVIEWQLMTYRIGLMAKSNKDVIGAASVDYLMYSGYVTMAFHWLKMEMAATKALERGNLDVDPAFYEAKILTSQFYFDNMLPRTRSLTATMFTPVESMMGMPEKSFSFDHAL